MKMVTAIYENGVFKPTEPVDLPEHCMVQFEPSPVVQESAKPKITDLSQYRGILKDRSIDPMEFQRKIRDEWD